MHCHQRTHDERQTGLHNGCDLHRHMDCAGVRLFRRGQVKLVTIDGEREVLGRNAAVKLVLQDVDY